MSYIFIIFSIIILAYCGLKHKVCRWLLFIFMSIILGYRCNVGTDFDSYKEYYDDGIYYLEPGFNFLCSIIQQFSGDAYDMFYTISFISLFFITLALNNKKVYYFPTAVLCFIFTFIFLSNGIRQGVAISIFFYAYKFIEERNFKLYICFIGVAALFHYSILIVLPLYFIANKYYKVYVYVIIYLVSLILALLGKGIMAYIEPYVSFNSRYGALLSNENSSTFDGYLSLGILSQLILYLFLLSLSLKCKIYERFPVIFNLFFLAVVFFNLRLSSYLFNRVEIIFSWFQYIIIPLIINSRQIIRYRQFIIAIIIVVYFTLFIHSYYIDSNNNLYPYTNILTKHIF